jgi:integrase
MRGCVFRDNRSRGSCWAIRYRDVAGQDRRERTAATSKASARELLDARIRQVERARERGLGCVDDLLHPAPAPTLAESAETYQVHTKAHCTKATQDGYEGALRKNVLPALGARRLNEVTPADVQGYTDARLAAGARPSTVRNELMVLSGIFREAIRAGQVSSNPVTSSRKPRVENQMFRYLSQEEEDRLLAAAPAPLRDQVEFAILTGLREGEQTALVRGDIQERGIVVRHTKSRRDRVVPTCDRLRKVIKRIPVDMSSPYVFTSPRGEGGGRYDRFNNTLWRETVKLSKIAPIRWHDLRHTFCSRLAQAGVPLQAIAELAGHSSVAVTMRYAHLAPGNLTAAVSVFDRKKGSGSTHRWHNGRRQNRPRRKALQLKGPRSSNG